MLAEVTRHRSEILSAPIDVLDWDTALLRIMGWASGRESRYVCICNVHSVVTASKDYYFREVIRLADMATPDGAPVAWMMRRLGARTQARVDGPGLMLRCCEHASKAGIGIFLLGSTPQTQQALTASLLGLFPALRVVGAVAPPFRALSKEEDEAVISMLNAADAGIVFVSFGCPKQEIWMADHRGRVNAVMIGVGAAFDFHSGTIKRAPTWMRRRGLEWLHRLVSEPRRLWRRYLFTNSAFIAKACAQLFRTRSQGHAPNDAG